MTFHTSVRKHQPYKLCPHCLNENVLQSSALWIDFNLRDNSITLIALSPTANSTTCLATVTNPRLKEKLVVSIEFAFDKILLQFFYRVLEEHELRIRGTWSVLLKGQDPVMKRTIMKVVLPINDRNAAWKAKVKSIFSFQPSTSSIFSQSQGNNNKF